MRNYIILNNKNSNTISGLIIQELAPISKPLQRTQVETIDGRDGDIVTALGYAAYNKKIKIGLYGNFNINEIIAYFATQGTAIFSNEPDKYYNYQILDQIDYERLVRFKVATVTMHVQPFKYSATEGTLTVNLSNPSTATTVINSGNTTSRPVLTVYGEGDIGLAINGVEVLNIELGDDGHITLDSAEMEAYKDTTADLKNRLVTGDYSKLALNAGDNTISFTGTVTKYEISKYSRWL